MPRRRKRGLCMAKKKLINEDDPRASTLMEQQIMSLRIWQRRWHRKNAANPERPSS